MKDTDLHNCFSSCKNRVQSGKIIFQPGKFLIPGRMKENGTRPVPLCLSPQRHMGQMGNPDCNSQRRLPVSLQTEGLKAAVPVSDAIELTDHSGFSVLSRHTHCLLHRGELPSVHQNIDSRNIHASIAAHTVPQSKCLGAQCLF